MKSKDVIIAMACGVVSATVYGCSSNQSETTPPPSAVPTSAIPAPATTPAETSLTPVNPTAAVTTTTTTSAAASAPVPVVAPPSTINSVPNSMNGAMTVNSSPSPVNVTPTILPGQPETQTTTVKTTTTPTGTTTTATATSTSSSTMKTTKVIHTAAVSQHRHYHKKSDKVHVSRALKHTVGFTEKLPFRLRP